MPRCVLGRAAVRTRLRGPRFRADFDGYAKLLGGIGEPSDESPERPEVVQLGVRPNRPVRLEYVGEIADIHRGDALVVQTFDQIPAERILCMVASSGPSPVQRVDLSRTGPPFAEF